MLVYRTKQNLAPKYLNGLLNFSENDNYSLRSIAHHDLVVPRPRTNYLKDTFSYKGPHVWNDIPNNIRSAESIYSFKKCFKTHLLFVQKESVKNACYCKKVSLS